MLIAEIAGISAPIYYSYQVKNDLDVTANTLAQTLRRAQVLSRAMDGDSAWGVSAQNQKITLFKGATYASRDSTRDEIYDLPKSITPSLTTEVVFSKFSGEPIPAGTIRLTSSNNEIRNIIINTKGMITY
jgi:hypothetical protein